MSHKTDNAFVAMVADALAQETRLPPPNFLQAHLSAFTACDKTALQATLDSLIVAAQSDVTAAQAALNWITALENEIMSSEVPYSFSLSPFTKYISVPRALPSPFDFSGWFGDYRCLHLLVQQHGGPVRLPRALKKQAAVLLPFFGVLESPVGLRNLPYRYTYLTIDTAPVKKGEYQRTPGWHVDGLQGDEVPIKQQSDTIFTWCDVLPFEYAAQTFPLPAYVNMSDYNIFEILGSLVQPEHIRQTEPKTLYCMDSYCVHRGVPASEDTDRTFVRLCYTDIPVTSTKMTLNPEMDYDYAIHTTSGEIPKHLKTTLETS